MSHSPGVSLPSAGHAGSCNTRGRAGAEGGSVPCPRHPLPAARGTRGGSEAPRHPAEGPPEGGGAEEMLSSPLSPAGCEAAVRCGLTPSGAGILRGQ